MWAARTLPDGDADLCLRTWSAAGPDVRVHQRRPAGLGHDEPQGLREAGAQAPVETTVHRATINGLGSARIFSAG